MAAPLATEKVLRATLQSLQRGGLVSSGSDVAKLEAVPNNATDQDISDILDTIVFGGVAASTDVIRGDEDVNVFVDADDNDFPLGSGIRYFRVADDQSDPPVTDPTNEILTAAKKMWSAIDGIAELIVGPRTTLATGNHRASIRVGATPAEYYCNIIGGPDVVHDSLSGMLLRSRIRVGIQADTAIVFGDNLGAAVRGGWDDPKNTTAFHVGDFLAASPESLVIEAEEVGGLQTYTIRPSYKPLVRRTYFRGSNPVGEYRCFLSIGGKAGETYGDPNNFSNPTFMVVGDNVSQSANAAYIYDRKPLRDSGSEVFTIKSNATTGGTFYYFRIINSTGTGVFSVDSDSKAHAPGGFITGVADVAEMVLTDAEYEPGTVLAIQDGIFTRTTDYQQINVAGVVSTKPGLLLGHRDGCQDNLNSMAIVGIVPVWCSTERGDILGNGETLVSGPDGCAVVDHCPRPGTIIGKAKGTLQSNGSGAVKGLVEVLVNLQ